MNFLFLNLELGKYKQRNRQWAFIKGRDKMQIGTSKNFYPIIAEDLKKAGASELSVRGHSLFLSSFPLSMTN